MDPLQNLTDTLKNTYRKFKTSHQWNNSYQSQLRNFISLENVDLAKLLSCDCKHLQPTKRLVLTFGESCMGKTTAVQCCALDWAEGKGYSDIDLLFVIPVWELTFLKKKLTFIRLLKSFYPELQMLSAANLNRKNVWFVFDGLDTPDVQVPLDSPVVNDVLAVSTLGALLANLFNGNLLPNAHIWITSRMELGYITVQFQSFVIAETEVVGLDNEQKEQLFRTVVDDDDLVYKAINHIKISRTLDSLCEIPLICRSAASVLKEHVKKSQRFEINPLNVTQIYTQLIKAVKPGTIATLKQIALTYGKKMKFFNLQFLCGLGISMEEVLAISREWPLLLREMTGLRDAPVFCFGHSSMQAYLAASVTLDIMPSQLKDFSSRCFDIVHVAVVRGEDSWDPFILFFFGHLKERNLLPPTDQFFIFTKKMILGNIFEPLGSSLYNYMTEYDREVLLPEIKVFHETGILPYPNFSIVHWAVLDQMRKDYEGVKSQFFFKASNNSDETLARSFVDILKSEETVLTFSKLTDRCCPTLVAAMTSKHSHLQVLDLGYNSITDAGVKELVEGINDTKSSLKMLRLQCCQLTSRACAYLATVLSKSRRLKGLDLSSNKIGDEGLKLLSNGLASPECLLEELRLSQCCIEAEGCKHLASALEKNQEHLKVLNLSVNIIRDKGAQELLKKFNISKLKTLQMYHCGLTFQSCIGIADALKYESSTLLELNLSFNNLGDKGLTILSEGMHAWCSLQKLSISRCGFTSVGCRYFSKVLSSVSQLYSEGTFKNGWQAVELIDLNLSQNRIGDEGADQISSGLECNPYSHLNKINLSGCSLTHRCCTELAKALASEKSSVREVDLSNNLIGDLGLKKLCAGLKSPHCTVAKLLIRCCGLSMGCIEFLVLALKCNPRHLTELHLMGNEMDESDIKPLLELREKYPLILGTIDFTATAGQSLIM